MPTIEAANLDTGALFYAQQKKDSESNLELSDNEESTSKRVTFEDIQSDTFHRYRKYGRSFSTQDNQIPFPVESIGVRRASTTCGSLEALTDHNEETYPHFHHVLSRHRPAEKERPRKGKIITDDFVLPTIEDVEHDHDEDQLLVFEASKESPEELVVLTEQSEHDADAEEIIDDHDDKVSFTIGNDDDELWLERQKIMEYPKVKKKRKKKTKRKSSRFTEEELKLRSSRGSEVSMKEPKGLPTDFEEAQTLEKKDLEDMTHRRFDHLHGLSRHKINKKSSTNLLTIQRSTKSEEKQKAFITSMYAEDKRVDHNPHNLFVEMDELIGNEWVEMSRWIKYEEAREEGSERWGEPHVSSLSFHSLLNLRLALEKGAVLLDHEGKDLTNVLSSIVEELVNIGYIDENTGDELLRVLLYRHNYVDQKAIKWTNSSTNNHSTLGYITDNGDMDHEPAQPPPPNSYFHKFSRQFSRQENEFSHQLKHLLEDEHKNGLKRQKSIPEFISSPTNEESTSKDHLAIDIPDVTFSRSASIGGDLSKAYKKSILMRVPEDTEGALTLVGAVDIVDEPLTAFVRLSEGIIMPNALEIPLPMRFIFLLLTPKSSTSIDCHEVGRCMSTLMSNRRFHNACYKVEERRELLNSINDYLDESVVLPPGDWDSKNMLSMSEINDLRKRKKAKPEKSIDAKEVEEEGTKETFETNPLIRAPYIFGGMINDWKRRFKHYVSDITDGFNSQTLAAAVFIYFASLSGAIAFGGLLGEKTNNLIGISETLILSSLSAFLFALFSGMPLIITGVTGPLLLYDESLFQICQDNHIDYLALRVWTGVWMIIIALLVAMFQGSVLVKYFTKFTKDVFSALVALLYIFEALKKLMKVYNQHPLAAIPYYCNQSGVQQSGLQEPNTALLSTILMFGTFFVAYSLRAVKTSHFLGRTPRKALGDFGVPIAIFVMVLLDFLVQETYTEKLKVPDGLQVTLPSERGWIINPMGQQVPLPFWMIFGALFPAILLYLLLFVETHICELLMIEKTGNLKGAGLHWDIVLLSTINAISTIFGGPFICAATVRAMAHVSALTVMSTTHAPGESPKVVEVKDQRLSSIIVSVLIGVSIYLSPLLKHVPYAVLFGVFLYMGISSVGGIQFFDRLILFFMPVKHHGRVNYVRRVSRTLYINRKLRVLYTYVIRIECILLSQSPLVIDNGKGEHMLTWYFNGGFSDGTFRKKLLI